MQTTTSPKYRVTASPFCVFDGRDDLSRIDVVYSNKADASAACARWAREHGYPFQVITVWRVS